MYGNQYTLNAGSNGRMPNAALMSNFGRFSGGKRLPFKFLDFFRLFFIIYPHTESFKNKKVPGKSLASRIIFKDAAHDCRDASADS